MRGRDAGVIFYILSFWVVVVYDGRVRIYDLRGGEGGVCIVCLTALD